MIVFEREHFVDASWLLKSDKSKTSGLLRGSVHHDNGVVNGTERTEILSKLLVVDGMRQPTDEYLPVPDVWPFGHVVSILAPSLLILLALSPSDWSILRPVLWSFGFRNILDRGQCLIV